MELADTAVLSTEVLLTLSAVTSPSVHGMASFYCNSIFFIQTGGPGVAPPCTDCEAASVVVAADQTLHAQGGACERFATDTGSSRDLVGSTASSWSDGSPWF